MARLANPLTRIQQDEEVFNGLREKIAHFTPGYLETLGDVSRTILYDYARGKPVSEKKEDEIRRVIEVAIERERENGDRRVKEAKQLLMA